MVKTNNTNIIAMDIKEFLGHIRKRNIGELEGLLALIENNIWSEFTTDHIKYVTIERPNGPWPTEKSKKEYEAKLEEYNNRPQNLTWQAGGQERLISLLERKKDISDRIKDLEGIINKKDLILRKINRICQIKIEKILEENCDTAENADALLQNINKNIKSFVDTINIGSENLKIIEYIAISSQEDFPYMTFADLERFSLKLDKDFKKKALLAGYSEEEMQAMEKQLSEYQKKVRTVAKELQEKYKDQIDTYKKYQNLKESFDTLYDQYERTTKNIYIINESLQSAKALQTYFNGTYQSQYPTLKKEADSSISNFKLKSGALLVGILVAAAFSSLIFSGILILPTIFHGLALAACWTAGMSYLGKACYNSYNVMNNAKQKLSTLEKELNSKVEELNKIDDRTKLEKVNEQSINSFITQQETALKNQTSFLGKTTSGYTNRSEKFINGLLQCYIQIIDLERKLNIPEEKRYKFTQEQINVILIEQMQNKSLTEKASTPTLRRVKSFSDLSKPSLENTGEKQTKIQPLQRAMSYDALSKLSLANTDEKHATTQPLQRTMSNDDLSKPSLENTGEKQNPELSPNPMRRVNPTPDTVSIKK